jgi:hypothetical protein
MLVAVARRLPQSVMGKATGGSSGSLVDTGRLTFYSDNALTGWWLFVLSGTNQYSVVRATGNTQSTGTLSVSGISPAAGDAYVLIPSLYDPYMLAAGLGEALSTIPYVEAVDETLTGDGESRTFTLPDDVAAGELRRVFVVDDDTDNPQAREWLHWEQRQDGTLYMYDVVPDGDTMRLVYMTPPSLNVLSISGPATDTWPADVPENYGVWYGVFTAHRNAVGRPGFDAEIATQLMNFALEMAENERLKMLVKTFPKQIFG